MRGEESLHDPWDHPNEPNTSKLAACPPFITNLVRHEILEDCTMTNYEEPRFGYDVRSMVRSAPKSAEYDRKSMVRTCADAIQRGISSMVEINLESRVDAKYVGLE